MIGVGLGHGEAFAQVALGSIDVRSAGAGHRETTLGEDEAGPVVGGFGDGGGLFEDFEGEPGLAHCLIGAAGVNEGFDLAFGIFVGVVELRRLLPVPGGVGERPFFKRGESLRHALGSGFGKDWRQNGAEAADHRAFPSQHGSICSTPGAGKVHSFGGKMGVNGFGIGASPAAL